MYEERGTQVANFFLIKFGLSQELKNCSVMLDRLWTDDKAAKTELEEKEDVNRKGAKLGSRIPTFHKRPSGVNQNVEPNVSKKDVPAHVAQPPEKAANGSMEALKSKLPDIRTLPLPSVRVPKIVDVPSSFFSTEQAGAGSHTFLSSIPKSLSESVPCPLTTVSPRPSIRPEQRLAEPGEREALEIEAETMTDAHISHLPYEGSVSYKPPEDTEEEFNVGESAEVCHTTKVSRVEAIMDEEPPWETEPLNAPEIRDSRSSSDVEYEDDLTGEECGGQESGEVEEHPEPVVSQLESSVVAEERGSVDESASPVAPEKPAKASSTESTKVSYDVHCGLLNSQSHKERISPHPAAL